VLVALGASGCARERASTGCNDDAGVPVDPALLAFLSRARAAHHAADAHEARNDLAAAEKELEAVVDGALPPQKDAPEVREVLADSLARLAELRARRNDFKAAERDIERGLGLVPEPSYFRGHLVEVRGLMEERRSKALEAAGDQAGASGARERALAAFQEAMRIQNDVIQRAAPER
jgi:tetratricopeptide (TPR) repeat protein